MIDWKEIADTLNTALRRLDRLHRAEYDDHGERPAWLQDALTRYDEANKPYDDAETKGQRA